MIEQAKNQYLDKIDATKAMRENLEKVYELAKIISPEDVEEIFVTNILADNGISQYLNAWFFTQGYVIEAKNFMLTVDIDLLPIINNVTYVQIKSENYDFKSAAEDSQLILVFATGTALGVTGELVSFGTNCQYLLDIYRRRFLPNIKLVIETA